MKIDRELESLKADLVNPTITLNTFSLADKDMATYGLRRKVKGAISHNVWYLTVTSEGGGSTTFWGHRPSDCIIQALKWKGVYVKQTKTRKNAAA